MIKITLDKELDKETFLNFFELKAGGVDFGKKIIDDHGSINKENYQVYIDDYYKNNHAELTTSLEDVNNSLQKSMGGFFDAVKDIFKQDFSEKEYFGALSIFDCNPRYLDKNIFQVYYKRGILNKQKVVYHEILHFIFFDYCDTELKNLVAGLDKNSGIYWELSELFNTIVLNLPELQKFLKDPEDSVFYPKLKKILPVIEKIWNDSNRDIRKFVEKSLDVLRQ